MYTVVLLIVAVVSLLFGFHLGNMESVSVMVKLCTAIKDRYTEDEIMQILKDIRDNVNKKVV